MKTKDFSGIRNNGPLPSPHDVRIPSNIGELLNDYVESTDSMLSELEQAALAYETGNDRVGNAAAIRRILHKLKGEASMVGVDEIAGLCHQAEDVFEELAENKRPDMLLRFKDWVYTAIRNMTD